MSVEGRWLLLLVTYPWLDFQLTCHYFSPTPFISTFYWTTERGFSSYGRIRNTAASIIQPQELCLIAAVTVTYDRNIIAAKRAYFGRKKLFWPQFSYGIAAIWPLSAKICSFGQNLGDRKSILRPKEALRLQPKGSYGRKTDRNSYGRTLLPLHTSQTEYRMSITV